MSVLKQEKKVITYLFVEIGFLLLCFVGIPLGIYLYSRHQYAGKVIDEAYWGITLPPQKEMQEILKENSKLGPHGEHLRHSIYTVKRNKLALSFRVDTDDDIETTCLKYCDELGTQGEYIPDFSKEYRWSEFKKYDDTLVLLYFVETEQLHIFENFF